MTTKEAVVEMIRQMPDDVTIPDIMTALCVRQKIERGLRELDDGKGIEQQEARKTLARWLV